MNTGHSRRLFFLVLLISVTVLVAGCGAKQEAPTGQESKILKVADTATVTSWDPSVSFSTEVAYMTNVYETLLWANPPGSPEPFSPALAEEWEHSPDGMEWTFHLKQGVKFHDGAELTAEAVKKSITRTIETGKGASFIWSPVENIEVVDTYTVKFELKNPVPFERIVSSGNGAWIMSPNVIDKDEEWFNQGNEAGSGPWKLVSYKPGEELIFEKFAEYHGQTKANFDKVVVKIVGEDVVRQQMIDSGQVDIATGIPFENLETLSQNPDVNIYENTSYYNFVGFFNTQKPYLKDKKVRQALSYAVPYQDIIDVATKGYAIQSRGPVPQGLWPGDKTIKQYDYDLDKAKELLEEAGVEPGSLKLKLTHASENPYETRFAPLLKESFAKIGVGLEVQPILWNQQWELAKGDPTKAQDIFVLMWWPTYSDGYDNLHSLFSTEEKPVWNLAYWYNDEYDKLIDEAYNLSGTNPEEAKEQYLKAQNMLVEEAPAIYFFDMKQVTPMRSNISGEATNPNYPFVIQYGKLSIE